MRTPHMPSIHFHSAGVQPAEASIFNPKIAWTKALHLAHSPWLRIRPRSALLSGSVFVLLSLFVPVAFNACGANRTGTEFLLGQGIWPGMASVIYTGIERGAYALGMGLAAFTLILLLVNLRQPSGLKRDWIRWPYLVAGLLFVFAIVDYVSFNVADPIGEFLSSMPGLDKPELVIPFMNGLAILLMVLCLRSTVVRSQAWILWIFAIEAFVCLVVIVLSIREQLGMPQIMSMDGVTQLSVTPALLYWLVPMGLWIRFGISHHDARRAQWQKLRPKIMVIYVPALLIAGILLLLPSAWPLWGVAPYLAGLSLIFLGYTELVHVDDLEAMGTASSEGGKPVPPIP